MTADLAKWVQMAQQLGTVTGLPAGHFIDGVFRPSVSGKSMQTFDPGTGRAFAEVAAGDAQDVAAAVRRALTGGISVPFGGNKQSGFGREKGLAALSTYSKIKSVVARI